MLRKNKLILGMGFGCFLAAGVVMAESGDVGDVSSKGSGSVFQNEGTELWEKLSEAEREDAFNRLNDEEKKYVGRYLMCSNIAKKIEEKFVKGQFDKKGYRDFCIAYEIIKNIKETPVAKNTPANDEVIEEFQELSMEMNKQNTDAIYVGANDFASK